MAIKFTQKAGEKPAPVAKADPAPTPAVETKAANPTKKTKRTKKPTQMDKPSLPLESNGIHPEDLNASNGD